MLFPPLPSLPGELPGNSHWLCQLVFQILSLCVPLFLGPFQMEGSTGNSSAFRSSRALTSCLPWNPWMSMEHPLCDAGYLVAPLCLLCICDKISRCNPGWSLVHGPSASALKGWMTLDVRHEPYVCLPVCWEPEWTSARGHRSTKAVPEQEPHLLL